MMLPGFPGAFLEQRLSRRRRRALAESRLPKALPCPEYYDLFPEEVGAVGNAVLIDTHELRHLLLVARPVSAEYARVHGGCVRLETVGDDGPQYLCVTDSDDEVYGRARYLPRPADAALDSRGIIDKKVDLANTKNSVSSPRQGDVRACSGVCVQGYSRGRRKEERSRNCDRAMYAATAST